MPETLRARQPQQAAVPEAEALAEFQSRAYHMLTFGKARASVQLEPEPVAVRKRCGRPDRVDRSVEARKFGRLPRLGKCMLLACRLMD